MENSSNVFKFQGSNMIVGAKGPNVDKKFRLNLLSSTMNMPHNFEKHSYTESVVSQRSIYGRESSPTASIRSDLQPRNFHLPFYQRGVSQRSVFNGRGGSPVSMRSIDSSVSIATDIVQAISSGKFNKYECKMIKQALNNRKKDDFWKRAEKRRKMQMYLKKIRKRPGDDSGEPWSNSSSSSDDCASTRTGYSRRYDKNYKENVPQHINNLYRQSEDIFRNDDIDSYGGYTRTAENPYRRDTDLYPENILPYQRELQRPSNLYVSQKIGPSKTTLFPQNNLAGVPKHTFSSQMNKTSQGNMFSIQRNNLNSSICSSKSMQNMTMMSQKDRFRGGFQFPSQKFNKASLIHEEHEQIIAPPFPNKANSRKDLLANHTEKESDEYNDIFLDTTVKPKPVTKKSGDTRQKRKVESLGDISTSARKKQKRNTTNDNDKCKNQAQQKNNNENNDFEFAKPQLPVRKPAPSKSREKIISKSSNAPELVFDAEEKENAVQQVEAASPEPEEEPHDSHPSENTQMTTSDMSLRPSFMKRKLFTQTLDVTEKKNNSSDSLATDSPQSNIYSGLTREKHKTRKLVATQSLLSREVQDDNNLLDLIHKIVPPNQVNSTSNITKSFNARISGSKVCDGDDKWDITSIISTNNNDSVSETYTDDEIFKVANVEKKTKLQEKPATKHTNAGKSKATNAKAENVKPTDTIAKPESKKTNNTSTKPDIKETNDTNTKPEVKKTNDPNAKPESKKTNDMNTKPQGKKIYDTNAKPEGKKKNDNINKISKVVLNKIALPVALNAPTPVKACPAKKVVKSSNRIDAFWNTDVESDYECAATPRVPSFQGHPTNEIASPKQYTSEIRPTKLLTKMTKPKAHDPCPVVVLKNDITPVKVLKKQASKSVKEPGPKTSKKSSDDTTPPGKRGRTKKGTPTIKLRTRNQINLSTSSETAKNVRTRKAPSPNKTAPITSSNQRKRNNEQKPQQNKNSVPKSSEIPKNLNIRQIVSQQQIETFKKLEDTPKSQRRAKNTTTQKHVEHNNDMTCKNLRSRTVDMSSSFNSDKFELTMSRTRQSRTPSKRISFNKLKNVISNTNKTRGRATKA